jgi:hypothetical protein
MSTAPWNLRSCLDHPLRLMLLTLLTAGVLGITTAIFPSPGGAVTTTTLFARSFEFNPPPTPAVVVFHDPHDPRTPAADAPVDIASLEDDSQRERAYASATDPTSRAYQIEISRSAHLRGLLTPISGTVYTQRTLTPLTGDNAQEMDRIPALYAQWLSHCKGEPVWATHPRQPELVESWWINPPALLLHLLVVAWPVLLARSVVLWFRARRQHRRAKARRCIACAYALDAIPHVPGVGGGGWGSGVTCPECGTKNPAAIVATPALPSIPPRALEA